MEAVSTVRKTKATTMLIDTRKGSFDKYGFLFFIK